MYWYVSSLTPFLVTVGVNRKFSWADAPYQLAAAGLSLLSVAEVMLVITVMEFSYTQAPKRMKSLVMSFFYCRSRQVMSLPRWSTR